MMTFEIFIRLVFRHSVVVHHSFPHIINNSWLLSCNSTMSPNNSPVPFNRTIKIQFAIPRPDKPSCPHCIAPIVLVCRASIISNRPHSSSRAAGRIPRATTHLVDVSRAAMYRFDVPRGATRCPDVPARNSFTLGDVAVRFIMQCAWVRASLDVRYV